MRLFLGIRFPKRVQDHLARYNACLQERGITGKFVREGNFHLTLAYIGETDRFEELQALLLPLVWERFPLTLTGTGRFSHIRWVGTAPCPELLTLAEQLRQALSARDFPVDSRPFTPHSTVARKVGEDCIFPAFIPVTFMAEGITVFHSHRVQDELTYTPIWMEKFR